MEQKTILKLPDRQDRLLRFLWKNKGESFTREQIENLKTGCTKDDFLYLRKNHYIHWEDIGYQSFSIATEGEVYVIEIRDREAIEKRNLIHEWIMIACAIISSIGAILSFFVN